MIFLDKPIVSFDLETAGVSPDRIVEIGMVKYDTLSPDNKITSLCRRINPRVKISKWATNVHGITNDDVGHEPSFSESAAEIMKFMDGCDLTGYNISVFDLPILSREFSDIGLTWPDEDTRILDAFTILKRNEPRTLSWALSYYSGQSLKNAHTAEADARAALSVLIKQAEKYGSKSSEDLETLTRDPTYVDLEGKLRWNEDHKVTLSFGKHSGKELTEVPMTYLTWMMNGDFKEDTKGLIDKEIKSRYVV